MFVDDNTKKIADEVISLTKAGVVDVWQKVQQAAPELWKMAVRQKYLDGVECAALAGGALVFTLMLSYWAVKLAKEDPDSEGVIILGGAAVGGAFVLALATVTAIDLIGNPSWWALKDILDLVRGH